MANITIQVDDLGQASVVTTSQDTATVQVTYTPTYVAPPSAPSGWDAMVAAYGQGYVYPTPTAKTSYRTGDEKDIEDTVFAAARAADKEKVFNTLASFLVLNNSNAFGTTVRFTDELGTEVFANNLIIDHFTGLMWYNFEWTQGLDWNGHIDHALGLSQGGYSDWFVPSINQALSINWWGNVGSSLIWTPFTGNHYLMTSTTEDTDTLKALRIRGLDPSISGLAKSTLSQSAVPYKYCRKHY
jgi:hypothetical protein